MLKTTITISGNYNTTPFVIFEQDVDEMIMLVNYLLDLGGNATNPKVNPVAPKPDNFWDF